MACIFVLCIVLSSCVNTDYKAHIDKVEGLPEYVDFNFHIKPILSDRCFSCHGPDENTRSTEFRLDTKEGAFAALKESKGEKAIVPGDPHNSEIFQRIISTDPEYRMPPPESNLTLNEREVALITKWIEQGAEWKPHWAFIPLETQKIPEVKNKAWPRNPIDHFVLSRLEQEGWSPSPEANKEELIRRVTFDLTGLPPSIAEIDSFLADQSANAYEKVVDRLLASPTYGERMATQWMDISRYADSHGYHADGMRYMWPWRDWVIKSYNENMPFDQFVTWQLAGDLLPNATREQKLATAFNRNHSLNSEGGIIDEEFRLEYVFDRTNTVGKALMGLTLECARCHDHKFDPISQKEYYQVSAFFNNVNELGLISTDGNAGPLLPLPDEEVEKKLAFVREKIREQEQKVDHRKVEISRGGSYENIFQQVSSDKGVTDGLVAHYPLDVVTGRKTPNASSRQNPGKISGKPVPGKGILGQALKFDSEYDFVSLPNTGLFEKTDAFSIGVWIKPDERNDYVVILGNAGNKNPYWRGYELFLDSLNRVSTRFIHALPHNYIHVTTTTGVPVNEWSHIMFTYDGSGKAAGLKLYLNGIPASTTVQYDHLYKSILPVNSSHERQDRAIRVGRSYRNFTDYGNFAGSIDDIKIYDRKLTVADVARVYGVEPDPLTVALALPKAKRSKEQEAMILENYLDRYDRKYQEYLEQLSGLRIREHMLMEDVREIMVMQEMETPRKTYLLHRGAWDAPGEQVFPGTPSHVMEFSSELPQNRLGFAQWLVDPANPLFSRVTVNRYWKLYFGKGIVTTPDDFGNQGALPTHPELLNWLALHFIESDWNVKAFQKMIVMSATYRQFSTVNEEAFAEDPDNALLSRGPHRRMTAEMIRDNALAASGLLVRKIGGPSVKPYQPEGLWEEKGPSSQFLKTYVPDKGDGLYRRSLYTFWKRTAPPPSMVIFNSGTRDYCIVERQSTNIPQQALVLLNDEQYVEAARVIGERMMKEGGSAPGDRIKYGFRLLTSRLPRDQELEIYLQLYQEELDKYKNDSKRALDLLNVGYHERDRDLNLAELASYAVVANVMMSHIDSYTK